MRLKHMVSRRLHRQFLPALTEELISVVKDDIVFKAPPLTKKRVKSIRLISPQYKLSVNEESRRYWELDQNAACLGEYQAISPILHKIPLPKRILDIGPGLGRSVVFFSKKLNWDNSEWHLYEGDGKRTKYTIQGPRFKNSFCGDIEFLRYMLQFNDISNCKIFDAKDLNYKLNNLEGPYDVIYSFFAIGFHWSLEHFLEEILDLMTDTSIAFFTIPNEFREFELLKTLQTHTITSKIAWPKGQTLKIILISKTPNKVFQQV